jgi:hypothetical protein
MEQTSMLMLCYSVKLHPKSVVVKVFQAKIGALEKMLSSC